MHYPNSMRLYRIKKLTRTVTDTNDVRLPCNTSTIGNSKEIQTQPSTTAVNESSISNGTADLQGQQDGQPSSGQMAGFIIGVIAIVTVVVVIVVVAVKFIRRRRQRKQSPFSGKSNKQTPSPSENSAGADVYYESPEVIRERKRRQREANQDAANLSYNKNESDGHVTGLDQTVYSYNHLREADNLQSGGELATNTYGHLQDFHETQTENETSDYYNLEATATSADVRAGQNTKYDNLSHQKVTGQSGSIGVTRADYDHVYIDHDTAV
ncbi:uncharacterized protein LOC135464612 [Liolophura sinensis]|uniref:uncharacterized protein LOC135464612 n=1 Tax=Liolophura sinensis TaxID=3198878 RepID=UPI003158201B